MPTKRARDGSEDQPSKRARDGSVACGLPLYRNGFADAAVAGRLRFSVRAPKPDEECPISFAGIGECELPPAVAPTAGACYHTDHPELTAMTLTKCGHSFNAMHLLYYFITSETVLCPLCRGGREGLQIHAADLPRHLACLDARNAGRQAAAATAQARYNEVERSYAVSVHEHADAVAALEVARASQDERRIQMHQGLVDAHAMLVAARRDYLRVMSISSQIEAARSVGLPDTSPQIRALFNEMLGVMPSPADIDDQTPAAEPPRMNPAVIDDRPPAAEPPRMIPRRPPPRRLTFVRRPAQSIRDDEHNI